MFCIDRVVKEKVDDLADVPQNLTKVRWYVIINIYC